MSAINIPIGGIYSGACWPGDEEPWLFEPRLNHNPPRELEAEGNFFTFFARNPLKSPDSEKSKKVKESQKKRFGLFFVALAFVEFAQRLQSGGSGRRARAEGAAPAGHDGGQPQPGAARTRQAAWSSRSTSFTKSRR